MRSSIRGLLLGWLLVPLLLLLVLGGIASYYRSLALANEIYDRALYDSVLTLGVLVRSDEGDIAVDLPSVARRMIEVDPVDDIYFSIRTPDGKFIAGNEALPALGAGAGAAPERPLYFDSDYLGAPVRVAAARVMSQGQGAQPVIIQVAETTRKRAAIMRQILGESVVPQVIYLLLTIAVVWLAVRQALQPLYRISSAMDRRSGSDLHPMSVAETPSEVQPLIIAFNNLMQRVADTFAQRRRFVANAAHQLRTPVAGMRALIEAEMLGMPANELSPTLERMHNSSLRMSRLVTQLLALSRAEPGAPTEHVDVDLGAVVNRVLQDHEARARQKAIRIDARIESGLVVKGDPLLLGELASNLLDNAIRYSPGGTEVVVQLRPKNGSAELSVIDGGPGISEEEREKVFERFYRGERVTEEGSGLGLAIVREIADVHGATVWLEPRRDQSGTRAVALFPLVPAGNE